MYPHHIRNMERIQKVFEADETVEALIFAGSVAHGFAAPSSDIDLMIVVPDDDYRKRMNEGRDLYIDKEFCDYEGGYIDGKYISREFMKAVADHGSDPARYAFHGVRIGFSRVNGLEDLIEKILQYPEDLRQRRIEMFYSEMYIWHWYAKEGFRHGNDYLITTATSKMVLFAAKLLLAYNRVFFPYHKWVIKQLELVPDKPEGMVECIHLCLRDRTNDHLQRLEDMVRDFGGWQDVHIAWNGVYDRPVEFPWEDKREGLDYI